MEKPFSAYEGDDPYIFVSYAHADDDAVYPEIQWLHDQGFNLWYDEGLSPGSQWHAELAESIENCSLLLFFVTPRSANSDHCQREVHYASDRNKQLLVVHLEASELPSGLSFSVSSIQAILRYELTHQQYRAKLLKGMSERIQQSKAPPPASPAAKVSKPRRLLVTLGLVGLVVGVTSFVYLTTATTEQEAAISPDPPINSIRSNWVAILPFETVSASAEAQQLADGITGDLISALSGLGMFSVSSHGTVRTYKSSSKSPRQISNELGIRYLIEGRVQKSGDQTRIGVTLVDGIEGGGLWQESKTYQGRDLLDIQDDVTRFVSRALDVELVRLESERVRNVPRANMQSWDLYVSAVDVWKDPTQATIADAITKHRQALKLEPDYVLSLGQLATLLTNFAQIGGASDRDAVKLEACQLADRVASLGQDSSFALFSAVHVLTQMCGEAEKAVLIARRIVAAYPNSGYNQTQLGNALLHAGQLEEALQVLKNAEQAFPDNEWVFKYSPYWKSMIFTEREDWDTVIAVSGTSLSLNPSNVIVDANLLANAQGVLNRPTQAKDTWNRILARFPDFTIENYEWFLQQGLLTDARVEPFVRGLKRAKVEE